MKCISCGAGISGGMLGSLVKCDYCGTTNSFVSRVKIEVDVSNSYLDSSDQRELQTALNNIEQGEYEDALETLENIVSKEDRLAAVYANMAICVFWLGRDDFSHLSDVMKLLKKASSLSNGTSEIEPFICSVVYNTAKISTLKVRYGSNLDNCINALTQTKSLVPDYPDRDLLVAEFVGVNSESLVRDVWIHIKRDKKSFDPPRTLLASLTNLVALDPRANQEATALAIICINQKGSKFTDVSQSVITSIKDHYAKLTGKAGDPRLEFPMFSSPKIVT